MVRKAFNRYCQSHMRTDFTVYSRMPPNLARLFQLCALTLAFLGCRRDPQTTPEPSPSSSVVLAASSASSGTSDAPLPKSAASTTSGTPRYDTYHNSRFAFAVDYPDIYDKKQESDNGDGITLQALDAKHALKIWGEDSIGLRLTMGLRTDGRILLREAIKRVGPVRESYATDDYYRVVYAGRGGQELNHEACFLMGTVHCFAITYPTGEKDIYVGIIGRMTHALTGKFDGTETAGTKKK